MCPRKCYLISSWLNLNELSFVFTFLCMSVYMLIYFIYWVNTLNKCDSASPQTLRPAASTTDRSFIFPHSPTFFSFRDWSCPLNSDLHAHITPRSLVSMATKRSIRWDLDIRDRQSERWQTLSIKLSASNISINHGLNSGCQDDTHCILFQNLLPCTSKVPKR